jgi:hypothetical protein
MTALGAIVGGPFPPTVPCLPTVACPRPQDLVGGGAGLAAGVAAHAAVAVLQAVASGITQSAGWFVDQLLDLITSSTTPNTESSWLTAELSSMERVALLVVLPVLMVATIGPVLRQDGRRLARVWAVGLPIGVFAGMAAAQMTEWALAATDALCAVILGDHGRALGSQFQAAVAANSSGASPVIAQIILGTLMAVGAVLVWLELMLRSAGVYVATFFMPLALIGYVWPATVGVARRAVEVLVALILSKFVVLSAVSLGLSALGVHGVDAAFSGAAVLLMAAFAPFALLRLAPVVEAAAIGHLEGMSRRPGRAALRTATSAAGAATHPLTQLVMAGVSARRANDQGAAARPVVAQPLPHREADYPFPPPEEAPGA